MALGYVVHIPKKFTRIFREDGKVSIAGLDKAQVLMWLYNCASCAIDADGAIDGPMRIEQATSVLSEQLAGGSSFFARVRTRDLYVDIGGDLLDPTLYDEANGQTAAIRAIELAYRYQP